MDFKKIALANSLFCACILFIVMSAQAEELTELAAYADVEVCADCHDDLAESIKKTPHGNKAHPYSPAAAKACQSCHGPGAAHVEEQEGDGEHMGGIWVFGKDSERSLEAQNAVCLDCHNKATHAFWKGSAHDRRDIACTDCHSIHGGNSMNLTQPSETELCLQCHKQVRNDIMKSSHHPIREGKMKCSDCHNVHGTISDNLISATSTNEKCYECHAEKRGPFLWEHAPVRENCSTCHKAHGSSHDKLMVTKATFLCQTCHSNARHPGTLYALPQDRAGTSVYSGLNNRVAYRGCVNCHSAVHGSNHPSGKSLAR